MKRTILIIALAFTTLLLTAQSYSGWESYDKLMKKTLPTNFYVMVNGEKEPVFVFNSKYCYIEPHKKDMLLFRRVYFSNTKRLQKCKK